MLNANVTIINKLGLHARASSKFVSCASRFLSNITVSKGSQEVNGKSIMGIMMLAASQGTELVLEVDGDDEEACLEALIELINNRFGEDE